MQHLLQGLAQARPNHQHFRYTMPLSDFLSAGISQVCYSQPGCVGDIVTSPGLSARDCCAETDDGQSYSSDGVNCFHSQCIGMFSNA